MVAAERVRMEALMLASHYDDQNSHHPNHSTADPASDQHVAVRCVAFIT